jgi:hypothetical protein
LPTGASLSVPPPPAITDPAEPWIRLLGAPVVTFGATNAPLCAASMRSVRPLLTWISNGWSLVLPMNSPPASAFPAVSQQADAVACVASCSRPGSALNVPPAPATSTASQSVS